MVTVTGSSAAKPYLQHIARQLAEQSVYLVYASTGSCVGVDAIVDATPLQTGAAAAPATAATYWDNASSTGTRLSKFPGCHNQCDELKTPRKQGNVAPNRVKKYPVFAKKGLRTRYRCTPISEEPEWRSIAVRSSKERA